MSADPRSDRPSAFGIPTAPQQVTYRDILRVGQEADSVPEIAHARLFDHLLPIGGRLHTHRPRGPRPVPRDGRHWIAAEIITPSH